MTLLTPGARGQSLEQKIKVTFSAPVMVPGEVLPAGSYVFEALQEGSLTRILSADEKHVYATLLTVPTERAQPAEEVTVILGRSPEGSPQRIESWFYPGDSVGSEFVYDKQHPDHITGAISHGMKDVEHVGAHAGSAIVRAGKFIVG
jgi:hypothetical protein